MRVTMLGHASVLVEIGQKGILIDPVFADPFGEGAVVSCPARTVQPEHLPKIAAVVLSKSHPDHLDVATLAKLPRSAVVVCPRDAAILYALQKLGFTNVRSIDAGTVVKIAGAEVLLTPSARGPGEVGVAIKDRSGTFWHQVDTRLSPEIVDRVRAVVGPVHLLFAAYAKQDLAYFGSQRAGYPTDELAHAVASARHVSAGLVVPASAGLRFTEPFSWINRFVFPISRQRFLDELARAAPAAKSAIGDPGDVFELRGGAVTHRRAASSVATMVRDDTDLIEHDPTAHVPPLSDPNVDGYALDVIERTVDETLGALSDHVRAEAKADPLLVAHGEADTVYGLGVVFPDGRERWLRVDFRPDAPVVERGDGPIRRALVTHRIAASVLTARARFERSYHYTAGLSRLSVITAASLAFGKVRVAPREMPDLLIHFLRLAAGGPEAQMRKHIDFWLSSLEHEP